MSHKSKSSTPAVVNDSHPALSLKLGPGFSDQIQSLIKLHPIILQNQESDKYETPELVSLRTSYKYIYVINWLYNCRGFIKLQSEYFDVDIFELELLNYFPIVNSSSYDQDSTSKDNQLFIQKLKLNLISSLQNSKLSSLNNFEKIFKLWFGNQTPLGGADEEDDDDVEDQEGKVHIVHDEEHEIKFDELNISDKFEILFILISTISNYTKFRDWIDKNNLTVDGLRLNAIYSHPLHSNGSEDYFLLFENNSLYKRTIRYNSLVIPKKRKLSPEDPNATFKPSQFDIEVKDVKFELLFKNIYEYNTYIKSLSNKKLKPLITKSTIIETMLGNEIKKRRYLANKKKEVQLLSLLSTRKRSLRLEIKEKQKQEEFEKQKLQEEYELKLAAQKRLERRRTRLTETIINGDGQELTDYGHGYSRDERLKLRRVGTPVFTPTPEVPDEVIEVEDEVKDEVKDESKEEDVKVDEEAVEVIVEEVVENNDNEPIVENFVSEDEKEEVDTKVEEAVIEID
ncbi:hypothetical protein DFJ63DRAFT_343854 [Scheffersomyces coipomensis]|uniref:uncharacterized protein n=1 Tax=Scheffersomyces coipomensis TaxID=1788519 RepID=UPI00315D5734